MVHLLRHGTNAPWHRSLYGRIALGYIPLIAIMLTAQAVMFLWLVDGSATAAPGLTRILSVELGKRLEVDPHLDLNEFAKHARPGEQVFVVMKDGRTAGERLPSDEVIRTALNDLRQWPAHVPSTWETGALRAVGVAVSGRTVGVLGIVPPTAVERFGAPIAFVGLALLTVGTLISSVVIFGPVHRRIQGLQQAAQRFGAGEFTARAQSDGQDEVAELAHTFNGMADELAVREEQLTASNRARQQLLADVSHELMTPLATVLGYLETLTMPEVPLDDERRHRMAAVARREAQRLERLVGDVLETARLEAGGADLDPQLMPVRVLFEEVITHHEDECRARRIRMSSSVAPGADAVFGDPFRLEQALRNLTSNALRHTPDGGEITLTSSSNASGLVLTVTDTGEGIAAEDLPLIFDRFYKSRVSHRVGGRDSGSGLGLSIVKAIAGRHGGQVNASSAVGEGTTVRIVLPHAPVAGTAMEGVPA
jgi:signal transduction histidine kinase